jgi:Ca2+-binding RTX toxin-like protein
MPRFRPLAIACAKLAVVLLCLVAFTSVRASVRAASGGNADLSIIGSASSAGAKVGHDVTLAPKIVNNGPDAATHVTIEVVPDTDLTILDADASGGTCTTITVVVCSRAPLEASGPPKLRVRATTTAAGSADTTAVVVSDTTDGALMNNSVSFTTQVGSASSACDLWGAAGNDRIVGNAQDEAICGRGGNDRLFGRRGSDRLNGGSGSDLLVGGPGKDRLIGGFGKDRCPQPSGDARRSCP